MKDMVKIDAPIDFILILSKVKQSHNSCSRGDSIGRLEFGHRGKRPLNIEGRIIYESYIVPEPASLHSLRVIIFSLN